MTEPPGRPEHEERRPDGGDKGGQESREPTPRFETDASYWESVLEALKDVLQEQADRASSAVDRFGVRSPVADWRRLMRWQILVPAGLVVFWLGVGMWHWWLKQPGFMPQTLVGIWRTNTPSHEDRGFQITAETIRIYTGERYPPAYPIQNIRAERQSNGVLYTIEYEQEGVTIGFPMFLSRDGGIRLPNLDRVLWFRSSQVPVPQAEELDEEG